MLSNVSENVQIRVNARHVALRSFYPQKFAEFLAANEGIPQRDITVDHVNGIGTDDRVENLQFLTRSENVAKSGVDSVIGTRTVNVLGRQQLSKEDLPGEVWQTSEVLESVFPHVKASNYGRVMMLRGGKTSGTPIPNAPKHPAVMLKTADGRYRRVLVSHVVYMAFTNTLPPTKESGLRIFHDRNAPETEQGTYRNYPQDLVLRTVSDLLRETWAKRKRDAVALEDEDAAGDAAGDESDIVDE